MQNNLFIIYGLERTLGQGGGADGEKIASQGKQTGNLQHVEYEFVCGNKYEITACKAKPLLGSRLMAHRRAMHLVPSLF